MVAEWGILLPRRGWHLTAVRQQLAHGVSICRGLPLARFVAPFGRKEQDKLRAALGALEAASRAKEADMAALQDGGSRVGALKQASGLQREPFAGWRQHGCMRAARGWQLGDGQNAGLTRIADVTFALAPCKQRASH